MAITVIIAVQVMDCPAGAEDGRPRPAQPPAVVQVTEEGPPVEPTGDPVLDAMTAAVIKLQPYIYGGAEEEARSLASVIHGAATVNGVDPLVALAVARRESSLNLWVGLGRVTGITGALGYFQVIPRWAAERTCGCGCDQADPECNAAVARRCPEVRLARAFLCEAMGASCDATWSE
jgi:hypothetical protein